MGGIPEAIHFPENGGIQETLPITVEDLGPNVTMRAYLDVAFLGPPTLVKRAYRICYWQHLYTRDNGFLSLTRSKQHRILQTTRA